jgi:phosphoribosylformylglycinamidine cyclo-ligase
VGTKVKLAAALGRWRNLGHDVVNHCLNDILVQNGRPLFFLDYIATGRLRPHAVSEVIVGVAEACRAAGCALLGGETAEMPGVYVEGALDVVGTAVGLADRHSLLPKPDRMQEGDAILGLASSGPHTNGYSLIRRLVAERDLDEPVDGDQTVADALLAPHRSYVADVDQMEAAGIPVLGLAHITGGGFFDNIPRILPQHLAANISVDRWAMPPMFKRLVDWGGLTRDEAYRVFNMGIGMVAVVPAAAAQDAESAVGAPIIGSLVSRRESDPQVRLE